MKKIILLTSAILAMSSASAYAGGLSISLFSPQPVYVAPPPPPPAYIVQYPVVQTYPVAYSSYYYPGYRYVSYDRWNNRKMWRDADYRRWDRDDWRDRGHGHGHRR